MEPTLDEAINGLFGTQQPSGGIVAAGDRRLAVGPWSRRERSSMPARAAMQQGDWAKFGTAMEGLQHQLEAHGGTVRSADSRSYGN